MSDNTPRYRDRDGWSQLDAAKWVIVLACTAITIIILMAK